MILSSKSKLQKQKTRKRERGLSFEVGRQPTNNEKNTSRSSDLHMYAAVCCCLWVGASSSSALTPAEMQAKMGLGINVGNRIDLYQQPAR